jgi:hypothetical protein
MRGTECQDTFLNKPAVRLAPVEEHVEDIEEEEEDA